jgi:hypothetical protein
VPVLQPVAGLTAPLSNQYGLILYLAQRIPGYDYSEYARELNSAYIHVWEEVSKLGNYYFTNTKTLSVAAAGGARVIDLRYNADGTMNAPLSQRLYQIMRVRCQPPSGGLFQIAAHMFPVENEFVTIEANMQQNPTQTGPYYWSLLGHGSMRFAIPLAQGTNVEIIYSYWPLNLTYLSAGSVTSTGSTVTGSGTNFTQLVQPDFAANLPTAGVVDEEALQCELVCNGNQIYRVMGITSDTVLTTATAISPALGANSVYALATVPEIPREHIRVIASLALAKLFSVAGDDSRVQEWTGIAAANMQMMKDSLIERQQANPPRRQRFQYGISRRNRAFLR